MMRCVILGCWLLFTALSTLHAQHVKLPEGKKAAIVLTYDDGLHSQLDHVVPVLDKYGLKGTFFLWVGMLQQDDLPRWKAAAQNGHELGNHTLYHPGNVAVDEGQPGRCQSLGCYTVKDIIDEIRLANMFISTLDGKTVHSYAYPWSYPIVSDGDYSEPMMQSGVVSYARTEDNGGVISDLKNFNPALVSSFAAREGYTLDTILPYIQNVREQEGVGVILFHGIGADWLMVSDEEHEKLLQYLTSQQDIWVAPFSEVLDYISHP